MFDNGGGGRSDTEDPERLLREHTDALPQMLWINRPDGAILFSNKRLLGYIGRSPDASPDTDWIDAVHPEDRVPAMEARSEAIATGIPCTFEFRLRRHDGAFRWHQARCVPAYNENGAILHWFGSLSNIHDLKTAQKALEEAMQRLAFHVRNSPLAVIEWDDSFRIRSWSPQAERIFGWTAEEVLGKTDAELHYIHEEDQTLVRESVEAMIADAGVGISRNRNYTKNGDIIYCEWYNSVLKDEQGEMVSLMSLVQDVTERVHAESALTASNARQTRIAETLQQSLLLTPPEDMFPGIELGTLYEGAYTELKVGGDFHDAFSFWDGRVCLAVGDVTGKGLEAAAYTAEVKFALRAYVYESADPADALARLNHFLYTRNRGENLPGRNDAPFDRFVTLAVIVLDTNTGVGTCACAGAEPPLLYRKQEGTVEEVMSRGTVLGADLDAEYVASSFQMNPGDIVGLTTDGLTETRDAEGRFFGWDGVARTLRESASLNRGDRPAALARRTLRVAKSWANGKLQDDVCFLLARYRGVSSGSETK